MSLVADYGSSDEESGTSDTEEQTAIEKHATTIAKSQTNVQQAAVGITETEEDEVPKPKGGLLAGLPPPKKVNREPIPEEDDVIASRTGFLNLPPPKKTSKKQPVKISLPELPDVDSDEDEEPKPKKPKPAPASGKKCGLFALLPAPKHATTKETNRVMIPHTLSKKPAAKPLVKTSPAAPRIKTLVDANDSDEDDDGDQPALNFFSLGESKVTTVNSAPTATTLPIETQPTDTEQSDLYTPMEKNQNNTQTIQTTFEQHGKRSTEDNTMYDNQMTGSLADAPLSFKSTTVPYQQSSQTYANAYQSGYAGASYDYNQPYYEEEYQESVQNSNSEEGFMKDADFLKMQGKKQRGKEEIHIVDVSADDFLDPDHISRSVSEETQSEYRAHKKKSNEPSNQQKRKHQITYLAFQAKERELDLKNQWAENRQTRRQTQSKYGF